VVPGGECAFDLFGVPGICERETVLKLADSETGQFLELIVTTEEGFDVGLEFGGE
jgi:hypothetical protein